MKRNLLSVYFLLLFASTYINGQKQDADSIRNLLAQNQSDTGRVLLLVQLSNAYIFYQPDSSIILAKETVREAQRLHFAMGEGRALNVLASLLRLTGELPQSLETYFKSLEISRATHDKEYEIRSLIFIGVVHSQLSEFRQGLYYFQQAGEIKEHFPRMDILLMNSIGNTYERMNLLDSALFFQQQAYAKLKELPRGTLGSLVLTSLGVIQGRLGNNSGALGYYRDALENASITGDVLNRSRIQHRIAELYDQLHQPDSSLFYARLAFINSQRASSELSLLNASNLLVKLYQAKGQTDSAFHYQQIAVASNDSLFGPEKFQRLQVFALSEQQRQQETLQEQERYKNKIRIAALLFMLTFFLIIAIILLRNNRNKQKVNLLLRDQKNEIQDTLTKLKSTQNQLVQREKMASLGELTSGIAHEIQNPLNFVNNFSEVNTELIDELKQEIDKGNVEEVKKIADEISENEQKITHHGKRADTIVKSMLQHSHSSSNSIKEPTDINVLAEEYLRLSYNGARAVDKSFTAKTQTDFDKSLSAGEAGNGSIDIVREDIGRVLLNLYNNAFYAVSEKRKAVIAEGLDGYEPTVILTTKRSADKIIISVKDNGNGVPQKISDKIFQPFFTTKPAGQGTGLGLSLSYDIVKSHGGELKVFTKEGEFAEFIIQLPISP